MTGKEIIVIGALAAGAYLLLGRSGALGGGVDGGNGKKATAITGAILPNDGSGGSTPTNPITPPPSYNTTIPNYGNITTPFSPSPYLVGLINDKYANNPPPLTKKDAAYEAGTQKMFKDFNYPAMVKTGGGYGYTDQQIYTPVKDMGKGILNERLNQVIVAPQSYVDSVSKKSTSTGFSLSGIAAPQSYVDSVSTPTKKSTSVTTPKTAINSPVQNTAPKYSGKKYGGWGG